MFHFQGLTKQIRFLLIQLDSWSFTFPINEFFSCQCCIKLLASILGYISTAILASETDRNIKKRWQNFIRSWLDN